MEINMRILFSMLLFGCFINLSNVIAADDMTPDKGDGCGLGWKVTKKKSFLGTSTRGTTNSFVPPTFGMTTGSLGCNQFSFVKNEVEGVKYAVSNHDALTIEMAEGQGEFLAGYAATFGCDGAAVESFGQMTKDNYATITDGSAVEMYRNTAKQLRNNAVLNSACQIG